MTAEWLKTGMFEKEEGELKSDVISTIINELGDHALTKSHARHLLF